jgi:hypothetical protein
MAFHFVISHSGHVRNIGDNRFNFVHVVIPHILITKVGEASGMKERVISLEYGDTRRQGNDL